jgi:hypothetical protein
VIDTPIWSKARLDSARNSGAQPQEVAAKVRAALEAGSPASRYQVGRGVRALILLRALLPDRGFDRIARRFVAGR